MTSPCALYLLGEMPVTLSAQGRSYLQRGIEDVVFLNLTFASGVDGPRADVLARPAQGASA